MKDRLLVGRILSIVLLAILALVTTSARAGIAFEQLGGGQGQVVFEAEHAQGGQGAFDGYAWSEVSLSGAVGNAQQIAFAASNNWPSDYLSDSARLDYSINFVETGTYYVWVRGYATDGYSDTVYVGLDDVPSLTGDMIGRFKKGAWQWSNRHASTGSPVTIEVTTPGVHRVNFWMRESGFIMDRMLVTRDAGLSLWGAAGPEESLQSDTVSSVAQPVINPVGGHFLSGTQVSLTTSTAGASIYYTTDGSTPSVASTLYSGAFDVTENTTVRAVALLDGYADSAIAEASFTVGNQAPVLVVPVAQTLAANTSLSFEVRATDADSGTPDLSAMNLPAGATFVVGADGVGMLSWAPSDADVGQYSIVFRATDAADATLYTESAVVIEVAATPSGTSMAFEQQIGVQGQVVFEAEHAHGGQGAFDGYAWSEVSLSGAVGNAQQIAFAASNNWPSDYLSDSARLDYAINFVETGTYYVWVRGYATDGYSDTVYVGVDGVPSLTGDIIGRFKKGGWQWSNRHASTGSPVTIEVTTPGVHRVNFWMRESGFIMDRMLVTRDAGLSLWGAAGPEESAQRDSVSSVAQPAINPVGGHFLSGTQVSLTTSTAGASIYYTTDGSTPSVASMLYSGAFDVTENTTVRAVALLDGYADSTIVEASFTVGNQAPVLTVPGAKSVFANNSLTFDVQGADADSGTPVLTTSHLPAGAIFTPAGDGTGTFSWTPAEGDVGNYSVVVRATDAVDATLYTEGTVVIEVAATPSGTSMAFEQQIGVQGQVVFEAEHAHGGQGAFDGYAWSEVSPSGAVGNAQQIAFAASNNWPSDYLSDSARLDYTINFVETGTYYVWVRGYATDGYSDTVYVGVDGVPSLTGDVIGRFKKGGWQWSNRHASTGSPVTIEVTTPGVHRVSFWMRESGFIMDRMLVTRDAGLSLWGAVGPEESAQNEVAPSNQAPEWIAAPDFMVKAGTLLSTTFEANDADGGAPNVQVDLSGLPGEASGTDLGAGRLALEWSVPDGVVGRYVIKLIATDSVDAGLTSEISVVVDVLAPNDHTVTLQQFYSDGKVVVEAEGFNRLLTVEGGSHSWQIVSNVNASADKVLMALDDIGMSVTSDIESRSPRVDFPVDFEQGGTYFLWVRGIAANSASDTVHAGLDGQIQDSGKTITGFLADGNLSWAGASSASGSPAVITVPGPGLHYVSFWMAEDGFALDKFILTPSADFVPLGHGPSVSAGGVMPDFPAVVDSQRFVWEFDEDPSYGFAAPVVGSASLSCAQCPQLATGIKGGAYEFVPGQSLVLSAAALLDIEEDAGFTVETFVRLPGGCSSPQGFVGRSGGQSPMHWALGCRSGHLVAELVDSDGSVAEVLESSVTIEDGDWHHVALVRDAGFSEVRLYVDGDVSANASRAFSGEFMDSGAGLTVGVAQLEGVAEAMSGVLDGLALHRRALRSDEISRQASVLKKGLNQGLWACQTPTRIMPLGDSITAGSNGSGTNIYGTYRPFLYASLSGLGYNVDFVGGVTDRHTGDHDKDHEGWPGIKTEEMAAVVAQHLQMNRADLLLVHLGTNGVSAALPGMQSILDKLQVTDPGVVSVIAKIIQRRTPHWNTGVYNDDLGLEVNSRIADHQKLYLVDMEDVLDSSNDYIDELHPNTQGAEKMAMVWFDQLVKILPRCRAAAPLLVDMNTLSASAGSAFRFLPEVLGHPIGQFTLESGPAGLLVNGETGEVKWESPVVGAHSFRVRVTNAMGSDAHDYSLTVN
ncbi:MAG: chitobiase/beta-hexosaminidase C-terminal domain-containing protein [Hahellaceae bacterium]|nr:chitobiase/beta-hexosaminidase C-terminal domain-containing protein [Hahellaceae bacterium]